MRSVCESVVYERAACGLAAACHVVRVGLVVVLTQAALPLLQLACACDQNGCVSSHLMDQLSVANVCLQEM